LPFEVGNVLFLSVAACDHRRPLSQGYPVKQRSLDQHIECRIAGRTAHFLAARVIFFETVLASGMAGVAGRVALGLQGDVIGRLPGAASSASAAASRAAFSPASRASRTTRDALRSAMRASRARLIACRAACRSAIAGSFVPDLARKFSSSAFFALAAALSRSSKFVLLELSISLHLMRGSVGRLRRCQKDGPAGRYDARGTGRSCRSP